ncbi:MAG: PEP-CTERM sorting domain-containing protein [Planctomycetes bacterium]|nr:PEP-CTERM sorting domain-containing protein [Planctomycetota bacterium]
MSTNRVVCALGVFLVWVAAPVSADIYTNADGFGVAPYVTFDEFGLGPKNGTEWQAWGVTFSAFDMKTDGNDGYPGIDGPNLLAYADPKLRIDFDEPMTAFAMAWITNPGTTTFTAYLGGSVVEQAALATDYDDANICYSVFENITFDAIEGTIDAAFLSFRIDNLQVPEPGALLPLMLGLATVVGCRRRAA